METADSDYSETFTTYHYQRYGASMIGQLAADEQREWIDLAQTLTADDWVAPSLCAGMSVRDVVVHIAAHIHGEPNTRTIAASVIASGFSISRAEKRLDRKQAERHVGRSAQDLIAWLSDPMSDPDSPTQLSELVIHQQDVRRAIDRPRFIPHDRLRAVLDHSLSPKGHKNVNFAGRRVSGLRLIATDMDWSFGDGPEVSGTAEALMMAANGRDVALRELAGTGAATLAERTLKWSAKFADMWSS